MGEESGCADGWGRHSGRGRLLRVEKSVEMEVGLGGCFGGYVAMVVVVKVEE